MLENPIPQPTNPGTGSTDILWFDTGDTPASAGAGGYRDVMGIVGNIVLDQDATFVVKASSGPGKPLYVVNGAGAGEAITANTPFDVRVRFAGFRTRVSILTGSTPPGAGFHVNGRLTEWVDR